MSSCSNNEKVIYQVWIDGKGSFAVRKMEKEVLQSERTKWNMKKKFHNLNILIHKNQKNIQN